MMQKLIAWTMGGVTVAAVAALAFVGVETDRTQPDGASDAAEAPVSVVIEQAPLTDSDTSADDSQTSKELEAAAPSTKSDDDAVAKSDVVTETVTATETASETETAKANDEDSRTEDPQEPEKTAANVVPTAVSGQDTEAVEAEASTEGAETIASETVHSSQSATNAEDGATAQTENAVETSVDQPAAELVDEPNASEQTTLALLTPPTDDVQETETPSAQEKVEAGEEPSSKPSDDPTPSTNAETDRDTAETPATPSQDAAEAPEDEADEDAPTFDVVRVERDGQTVIAGRAKPDERVEVLLDGEIVGEAIADRSGQFVAVIFANLTDDAQKLELRSIVPVVTEPEASTASSVDESRASGADHSIALEEQPDPGTQTALSDQAPETSTSVQGLADPSAGEGIALQMPSQTTPVGDVVRGSVTAALGSGGTAPSASTAPEGPTPETRQQYAVSSPVIILPSSDPEAAPTLVQPQRETLALLQPAERAVVGVVLDSVTYDESGAVILSGRGVVERVIRIYANGEAAGTARVDPDGRWVWATETARPEDIKLFRMDELGPEGSVTSRVETPFTYSRFAPKLVQDRRVVIQRGDALWRIAEQFYGEGIRYSMIYGANTELIRDPDLIYPGQIFTIPELVDAN
ncbi:MAG: LysM peptidoglycan-binding domain-containing protein [Pseudomonadota bacterium]